MIRAPHKDAVRMKPHIPDEANMTAHTFGARRLSVESTLPDYLENIVSDLASQNLNFTGGSYGFGNLNFGYDDPQNDYNPGALGSNGTTGAFMWVRTGYDTWPSEFRLPTGGVGLPNVSFVRPIDWHAATGFCFFPYRAYLLDGIGQAVYFDGYRVGAFRKFCTVQTVLNSPQATQSLNYFVVEAKYGREYDNEGAITGSKWEYQLLSTGNVLEAGPILGPGANVDIPGPSQALPIAPLSNGYTTVSVFRFAIVGQSAVNWALANNVAFE